MTGLRAAYSNFATDTENKAFLETFQKRIEQVLDRVKQVTVGLSEDSHPDILSPQRKNLRQTGKIILMTISEIEFSYTIAFVPSAGIQLFSKFDFITVWLIIVDFLMGNSTPEPHRNMNLISIHFELIF